MTTTYNTYYKEIKTNAYKEQIELSNRLILRNIKCNSMDEMFQSLYRVQKERFPDAEIREGEKYEIVLNTMYFTKDNLILNKSEYITHDHASKVEYILEVKEIKD